MTAPPDLKGERAARQGSPVSQSQFPCDGSLPKQSPTFKRDLCAVDSRSDIISRPPLPSLRGGRCRNEPAHKTAGDRPCSFEGLHARPDPRREPPAEAH